MDPKYTTWTASASSAPPTTEPDHGDSSSTEDVESPRSVVTAATPSKRRGSSSGGRWRWWRRNVGDRNSACYYNKKESDTKTGCLHSQVLRIKEEEMQISEDLVGDHYSCYGYVADCHSSLDDVWFRNSLPASPLGGSSKRN